MPQNLTALKALSRKRVRHIASSRVDRKHHYGKVDATSALTAGLIT
jgi:hypothetical protein